MLHLKGLLNYWLMGDCNELIVSEISSYGTNAAARTGLKPVVCTHERVCYRRLTSDPCQVRLYFGGKVDVENRMLLIPYEKALVSKMRETSMYLEFNPLVLILDI